jgi:hypothetical protein
MRLIDLHPGLQVLHPTLGIGDVKVVSERTAEVLFNEGRRMLAEDMIAELKPARATAKIEGQDRPLHELIAQVVDATVERLDLRVDDSDLEPQIGPRWINGKVVLHPADTTLATKEVEMNVFFRKIISVRDNLRVLEQKINTHPKLDDTERIELQHYLTKCYGSLTTFNLLFKDKGQTF